MQSGRFQSGSVLLGDTGQQFLDLGDRLTRVQTLRTGPSAVHDGVAPVHAERILQLVQPGGSRFVTGIDDPTVGLHEHGRAQVLVAVPPVRGARGRTARAQDALVQTVQLGAVVHRLEVLGVALLLAGFVPEEIGNEEMKKVTYWIIYKHL